MLPISIPTTEVLNYVVKPITEQDNLMNGTVGTRKVASYLGVKSGDPISAFTLPDFVIQKRPTTAQIDAGSVTPFGNPTVSKQTWDLKRKFLFMRMHNDLLTKDLGLPNYEASGLPSDAQGILNNIASVLKMPFSKDVHGTAFWSHPTFDPDADYTATHDFPTETIASYQEGSGFMKLLSTALAAGDFSNYKTTTATGGIDVSGSRISAANANVLMEQMLAQAPRKLRNQNANLPSEFRPFFLISNDFFYALESYIANTFGSTDSGYLIFATGTDGRPDMNTVLGLKYRGFEVYNAHGVLDEYWEHTDPSTLYNHMGVFTSRENLSLGFNLRSPNAYLDGDAGLIVYARPEPELGAAVDLSLYLEMDSKISDSTLFSTVGLELAP